MLRVGTIAAAALAALIGLAATGCHTPTGGPGTEVVHVVPVDRDGQPVDGYRVTAEGGLVDDCTNPSPSAVADDIYLCFPYAAGAYQCWPSPPESMLCLYDPTERQLRRVTYTGELPEVYPIATPEPLALRLDDGTLCFLRHGGAWGVRTDGYEAAYGCSGEDTVLRGITPDAPPAVDRSDRAWTVQVGPVGPAADPAPPQTRTVATAWFAGDPG